MTKALYPMIFLAPLAAACYPIDKTTTCGPVATVAAVETLYTKEGFPIIDDQSAIPAPCVASGIQITNTPPNNPPEQPEPPITPEPPTTPQKPEKVKGNNGWGNGDQDAPANSENNNNAENNGGNHNGQSEAPARSWHNRN